VKGGDITNTHTHTSTHTGTHTHRHTDTYRHRHTDTHRDTVQVCSLGAIGYTI